MSKNRKGKGRDRFREPQTYSQEADEALSLVHAQRDFEEYYKQCAALTPVPLHADLHRYLKVLIVDRFPNLMQSYLTAKSQHWSLNSMHRTFGPDSQMDTLEFLEQVLNDGLLIAVMSNVTHDHADAKDANRGIRNRIHDRSIVWPVIRYVLANPCEGGRWDWLETALMSAEQFAIDHDEAVLLLANYLSEDSCQSKRVSELCPNAIKILEQPIDPKDRSFETAELRCRAHFVRNCSALVALSLSKLAPDTPGLVDVLVDALSHEWHFSPEKSFTNIDGADLAAEALVRLASNAEHKFRQ